MTQQLTRTERFATPNRNHRQGLRCEKHKGTSGVNQDGADDPVAVQDTQRFKEVLLTVINFIADKDIEGEKGVTLGQVIRETGADAGLIDIALRWLQIGHKSHPTLHITRTVPERYTFRDTRVRVVPRKEVSKELAAAEVEAVDVFGQ